MAVSFEGKVALVTGGASGIGAAACRRFAAGGAKVVVADRNFAAAQAFAEQLDNAVAFEVDVAEPDACIAMVAFAVERFGRLDCAFNNAGITEVSVLKKEPLPETHLLPLHVWKQVLAVDLDGVFHCLRAQLPVMLEQGGGAIVNTASLQGHISYPRTAPYTAAKHGVVGLTKAIAKEYGNRAIRCNAVSPGVVDTPLNSEVINSAQFKEALLAPIPLGRFAEADDIARAVTWLCSDDAGYINGAVLLADGGYLA